jgi:acyl transferase domain-containing protein
MGRTLLEKDPVFAETVARLDSLFKNNGALSVLKLFQDAGPTQLNRSENAHLLTFTYQVALSDSLATQGIYPAAVIGHSSGEVAAACRAGSISETDAVNLVIAHCRLIEAASDHGAMLFAAVSQPCAEALVTTFQDLEIAAFNGQNGVVFSGLQSEINRLAQRLQADNIFCRPLSASTAFHSHQIEPYLEDFEELLAGLHSQTPSCDYFSSLTGDRFTGPWNADYWKQHIRQPVRFSQAVGKLFEAHQSIDFLEISPHSILSLDLREESAFHQRQAYIFSGMEKDCQEDEQFAKLIQQITARDTPGDHQTVQESICPATALDEVLREIIGHIPPSDDDTSWFDLGLESLQILKLSDCLSRRLGRPLSPELFFRKPRLVDFLAEISPADKPTKNFEPRTETRSSHQPVA